MQLQKYIVLLLVAVPVLAAVVLIVFLSQSETYVPVRSQISATKSQPVDRGADAASGVPASQRKTTVPSQLQGGANFASQNQNQNQRNAWGDVTLRFSAGSASTAKTSTLASSASASSAPSNNSIYSQADVPAGNGVGSGLPAQARLSVGGQVFHSEPNQLGLFPKVGIDLNATVNVAVTYPEGSPGDLIVVQADDGGTIADGKTVIQAHLDNNRQVTFPFQSTNEGGVYHVTLRNGFDEKRLEFFGNQQAVAQTGTK